MCPHRRSVPTSPTTRSRRHVLRAAGAGLGLAALTRPRAGTAQPLTPVTVALDWYPNANHAGLYLALARGDFAAAGLDVAIYTPSDPTTVLQTVGAGRDTFGISYQTDVLLARAAGVPMVAVAALVQQPLLGIMVPAASGIARPGDLAGKRIGYPGIPSQEAYLATMLAADGLTIADVELINIGFDLVPALLSGQVSASLGSYWTHETILAEREGLPVTMLKVDDWGVPSYYELVLVTSDQQLTRYPDVVRDFVAAMQRGYIAAAADPAAALEALAAASPELDRAVEAVGIELLIPAWTAGGVSFGTQTAARWDEYAAWMIDNGLLPADVPVSDAYSTAYLPTPAAAATPTT